MKYLKQIIIIIILLLIYIAVSLIITNFSIISGDSYLFIGKDTRWVNHNNSWKILDSNDFNSMDLSNFMLYNMSDYSSSKYNLKYDKVWYYSKSKNDYQKYSKDLFAYKGRKKFNLIKTKQLQFDDKDYNILDKVLSENNIRKYTELSFSYKIKLDYNNDDKDEYIYFASNVYAESVQDNYFSIIYTYSGNNYNILCKDVTVSSLLSDKEQNTIYAVVDYNNDNQYEIITNKMMFSNPDSAQYSLFELENGKYKNAITNG